MKVMSDTPSIKTTRWLHVTVWLLLFALPLFRTEIGQGFSWTEYVRFAILPCSFMLLFYLNYYVLIPRYLFERENVKYWLYNIAVIAGLMILIPLFVRYVLPNNPPSPPRDHTWFGRLNFLIGNIFLYFLVIGVSVALRMTWKWYQSEATRKELEQSRTEAELQNLKSQLNPHFLFNTLNNIYSLIQIDPDRAQNVVHDLSKLLRYVLYDASKSEVLLTDELMFMRNYIALMHIRLSHQVDVRVHLPLDGQGITIAPLLFITLLENAFKHGVSGEEPSEIDVDLQIKGEVVTCTISNSFFPKTIDQDKSGSGIGLVNLQRRLEMIYPHRFEMHQQVSDGFYQVYLAIKTLKA